MSRIQIGSWVWGEAMNPCEVIDIGTKRSTGQTMLKVLCSQGSMVIPLESVKGVVPQKPNLMVMPRPIQVGDRVRHRQTNSTYKVIELYQVRCDRNKDDEPFFERWARLQTSDGRQARWKLQQLEAVT